MQGSHTHIPETNHVPKGYTVAAILSLLFMVPLCLVPALALLFFYVSTFRNMCAVPIIIIIIIIIIRILPVLFTLTSARECNNCVVMQAKSDKVVGRKYRAVGHKILGSLHSMSCRQVSLHTASLSGQNYGRVRDSSMRSYPSRRAAK